MELKERIKELMQNKNIDSYTDLLIKLYNCIKTIEPEKYKDNAYDLATSNKSNFSQMMEGNRPISKNYYIPLERVLGVSMDYILYGTGETCEKYENKGIRYAASCDVYSEYGKLSNEINASGYPVIYHEDEYGKNIIDYIIEYKSVNGLKYIIDELGFKYNYFMQIYQTDEFSLTCKQDKNDILIKMLADSCDSENFMKVFHPFDLLKCYSLYQEFHFPDDFLASILNSKDILKSLCCLKSLSLKEMNVGSTPADDKTYAVANPMINYVLRLALKDPERYSKQINFIIDKSIKINESIEKSFEDKIEENYKTYSVGDNGFITDGAHFIYGCTIIGPTVKDPSWPRELKSKLEVLNNSLVSVKAVINNEQLNSQGHLLKAHSNNEFEYKFYELIKSYNLPVPVFYGCTSNVDELSGRIGNKVRIYAGNHNEYIGELVKFVKKLHLISETNNEKGYYVHGNLSFSNSYFTEQLIPNEEYPEINDTKICLSYISDWQNVHIGSKYEDMFHLLINCTGILNNDYSLSFEFSLLKYMLLCYCADSGYINGFIDYSNSKILELLKSTETPGYNAVKFKIEKNEYMVLDEEFNKHKSLAFIKVFFEVYSDIIKELPNDELFIKGKN